MEEYHTIKWIKKLRVDIEGLFLLEIVFTVTIFITGLVKRDNLIILYSIGMISFNFLNLFKNFYQAVGSFDKYSKVLNCETIILFLAYLIFIIIFRINNGLVFIAARIVLIYVICFYCVKNLEVYKGKRSLLSDVIKNAQKNIRLGFLLMLGNFATSCFSGIDRWFVKIFMDAKAFAIYAFAVSMEQAVNTFITPITLSMYNYFCRHDDWKIIKKVKNVVTIWAFLVISIGFLAKHVINIFLPEYLESTQLIFVLFAAMAFHAVIKGIYLNIYKANNKQNLYFKQMVVMIILAVVLNVIMYKVFKNMLSIAVATLVVAVVWLIVCERAEEKIRYNFREGVAVVLMYCIYLLIGIKLNGIVGFLLYIISNAIIVWVVMREELFYMISSMKELLKSKIRTN